MRGCERVTAKSAATTGFAALASAEFCTLAKSLSLLPSELSSP